MLLGTLTIQWKLTEYKSKTNRKMNTEKISNKLEQKSRISLAYLFIAVGLIMITLFPGPYTQGFNFMNQVIFRDSISGNFTFHNFGSVMLWAAAAIYLAHYIYGSFTYPRKYEEILVYKWVQKSNKPDSYDFSYMRGIFATLIVLVAFYYNVYDLVGALTSFLFIFLWLLVNAVLYIKTGTYGMFSHKKMNVDVGYIYLSDNDAQNIKQLETVFYEYPHSVNENEWKIVVAAKYMDHCRLRRTQECLDEAQVDRISYKAYEEFTKRFT